MTSPIRGGASRTFRAWVPAAAYMALILGLSSIPNLAPPGEVPNLDKVVHLGEYGILGFLLARGFTGAPGLAGGRRLLAVVVLGAGFAALDELYQGTVPGRVRSAADAIADVLGVILGAILHARTFGPRGSAAGGKR